MSSVLWLLAVPAAFLGLILLRPPQLLADVHIGLLTAVLGTTVSVLGFGWSVWASKLGQVDPTAGIPSGVHSFLKDAYRLDGLQDRLFVRPAVALARVVAGGDRDVVDGYIRGGVIGTGWLGVALRRAQSGLATGYVAWLVAGALVVGLAGVVLS
jgi:NADH-quinone oxidoreductase subunit L